MVDGSDFGTYFNSKGQLLRIPLNAGAATAWGWLGQSPHNVRLPISDVDVWSIPTVVIGPDGTPAKVGGLSANGLGHSTVVKSLSTIAQLSLFDPNAAAGTAGVLGISNTQQTTVSDSTTTDYVGPDIKTYNARAVIVELDVSSLTTTGSISLEVDWKAQDGTYRSLWSQATGKTSAVNQTVILGMGSAGYAITAGANGSTAGIAGRSQADSAGAAQLGYAPVPIPPIIRVKVVKVTTTVYVAKVDVVLCQ